MPDDLPVPSPLDDILPAKELDPGIFSGENWELILAEDGWYVREGRAHAARVTVRDAVARIGRYGRAPVFKATREYIADLGRALADEAYISAVGDPPSETGRRARERGLDPKLPSEQIARAGHIIGRLGDELGDAEAAPVT